MNSERPVMLLADAIFPGEMQAIELQLGMDVKGRVILILKRNDQKLWFHLDADRAQKLVQALVSAQLNGLIR